MVTTTEMGHRPFAGVDMLRETLVSLFCRRVASDRDRVALRIRHGEGFESLTWSQLAEQVRRTAAALRRIGLRPGDRLIQVSENRLEWIVLDLAIHLARGVHVAVHSTLTGPQIVYQVNDSGSRIVVVSGADQAQKLAAVAGSLLDGVAYFSFDRCAHRIAGKPVDLLADVVARVSDDAGRDLEADARQHVRPDTLATILYTSGTTGEPKGVMLSHGNLASNALSICEVVPLEPGDAQLCWLPLSHVFARTADLYVWIAAGLEMGLAQSRDTILPDCALLRPVHLNGVPYFFDKLCRYLQDQGKANEPGALQKLLGGRIKMCCSGGAALPDHVAEFFQRQDVLLAQGYGLTESSPVVTVSTPEHHRIGTVGRPIPGVEVRIADDGEVHTRGPHVMLGYWNLPQATAEAIRDGWLHTGDLGCLEDGYLRITGRKKELIVTAGGKNVAPVYLECLLLEDPLIAQAMIVGDGRNYLSALIVPQPEPLKAEIIRRGIPVRSAAEALKHPRVYEIYDELIHRRLAAVANCEQVRKFVLLSRAFTMELEELTPTLKLRRQQILEHFRAEIEAMYAE